MALIAFCITLVAIYRLEGKVESVPETTARLLAKPRFLDVLREVWQEVEARRFTIFIFTSLLAYSAQDLILEPFAGTVFGFTPGESTRLAGLQHGGVLAGMLLAAFAGTNFGGKQIGTLRGWTMWGCMASAVALIGLVLAGQVGAGWPFKANVFVLGVANGAFSIAAIGSMMRLAGEGREAREGVRMGLWGASQAIAFGLGGLLGAAGSDLARLWIASPGTAYGTVFLAESLLFVVAAALAGRISPQAVSSRPERAAQLIQSRQ